MTMVYRLFRYVEHQQKQYVCLSGRRVVGIVVELESRSGICCDTRGCFLAYGFVRCG
jgi:hypothetical protein